MCGYGGWYSIKLENGTHLFSLAFKACQDEASLEGAMKWIHFIY